MGDSMGNNGVPSWATDLIKEASEAPGDYPTNWDPSPGEVLSGTVVGWKTAETKYGERDVLEINTAEGPFSVMVARMVLVNQLSRAAKKIGKDRLEEGDDVCLIYNGERESASGNTYHDYVVAAKADEGMPF